jgi:transposase
MAKAATGWTSRSPTPPPKGPITSRAADAAELAPPGPDRPHERDDGITTDEREELARLRRENQRLRQERDLLKRAAAFATENGAR